MADGMDQPKEELHLDANEAERVQAAPTEQQDPAPAQGEGQGSGMLQIATVSWSYIAHSRAHILT